LTSAWSDADARAATARYAAAGIGEDLALRTYSARLLGADPTLVLHGGGNTSVKTRAIDLFGEAIDVLHVKGSGWDLATIEPAGHPAVRLAPLLRLRRLDRLTDEDMVGALRQNLLDSGAPNPSVETLLHAFIPARFIDHTHAEAVLALANQPDSPRLIEALYGARVACVPYVMPGFALARLAADIHDADPNVEGLILLNHGVFSFGATARESYERMIALVQVAEDHIAGSRRVAAPSPKARVSPTELAACLPILRGALARAATDRWPTHWVLETRAGPRALAVADDSRLADWAARGVATPDHVIRTKRLPLVLSSPGGDLAAWRGGVDDAVVAYASAYKASFARNLARFPGGKTALDPLPRLVAIPGIGLVAAGRTAREAAVAADIAQSWAATLLAAEAVGRFTPLGEADTFDMEYWSLEQAKLGKAPRRALEGRIVAVTGGAGAIGAATLAAFAAEGAEVVALDLPEALAAIEGAAAIACDVTDPGQVEAAFASLCRRFGGVDIVVSNAGAATTGMIAEIGAAALRASFDLNLFAHQAVAQAAVGVFRAQGMGGALLFNASKQALNPGPDFGAYGAAKAALIALMRQYALEHGADGVRANAINADRVRSGLLTPMMIAARARARGVAEDAYMTGNLLGQEVTAADVAQAFVFAARMMNTTGAILTVDGGAVAAMVR